MASLCDALGVNEDADVDALRRAYKATCLANHPDKLQQLQRHLQKHSFADDDGVKTSDSAERRLAAAQTAWKVLGDKNAREAYDNARRHVRNRVVNDTLPLDDLDEVEDDGVEPGWLYHDCRCGGRCLLSPADRLAYVDTLPCNTCSLAIRIILPP
jgi:curved DNA-binding protein CbpA